VPSAPIDVLGPVERLGQRPVRGPADGESGLLIQRRAHQRMAELDASGRDPHQSGGLGGRERPGPNTQRGGRPDDHPDASGVVGRGQDQNRPRLVRQPRGHPGEQPLDTGSDRQRDRQRLLARQLGRGQRGRQLDQGERVPAGLLDQPGPHLISRPHRALGEERTCRVRVQTGQGEFRQAGRGKPFRTVARYKDQQNALGLEPSRDEQQRVHRRGVAPLSIVHRADQPALRGDIREQGEHGHRDQEAVLAPPRGHTQRAPQRGRLNGRQPVDTLEDRVEQLMQRRER
jgi:hypothetical protein